MPTLLFRYHRMKMELDYLICSKGTSEGDIKKEAEEFVAELKCNFFLAGSSWGKKNDQTERFTKDSIWEKGFEDDSYADTINKIKEGDILIIKSTYAQNGVSYLKVKALGIVTHNPQDGTLLNVDWREQVYGLMLKTLAFTGIPFQWQRWLT